MACAVPLCRRFAIITTSPRVIPYTEDVVQTFGFAARCAAIRAVPLPPLEAPPPPDEEIAASLAAEAERAHATSGAEVVILGGARLSPYAAALRRRTPLTVIEPVACGVAMAEALVRIGLRQGKAGNSPMRQEPDRG